MLDTGLEVSIFTLKAEKGKKIFSSLFTYVMSHDWHQKQSIFYDECLSIPDNKHTYIYFIHIQHIESLFISNDDDLQTTLWSASLYASTCLCVLVS